MRAQVIVVAGPSGSGKSRLAARLGLPVLNLDDFYRSAGDPALPRLPGGLVDWDTPASWLYDEAVAAIKELCRSGRVDVPVYDISRDGRVGHQVLDLGAASSRADLFVAEGIFAQEVVGECRSRGLVAEAICVTQHPAVTFWRRLTRDLREHRKPPLVLIRRGLRLAREQRAVVAHAVALGCTPLSPEAAFEGIRGLVGSARR